MSSTQYTLYANEDIDLMNGRKYVCLPSNKKLTENDKKKYNIM